MSKNKEVSVTPPAPETQSQAQEIVPAAVTVIATVPVHALTSLQETSAPLFVSRYRSKLEKTGQELPSIEAIQGMLAKLPAAYSTALGKILKKTMGPKDGIIMEDSVVKFPELRLFQGTGTDPNRPENTIPGQLYLNTKESVGKTFEGTLLGAWAGSTMWPGEGESARVPVCHSMDQKVGSTFGECAKCPNMPFRNGQRTLCGKDVVAFMLSKDLKDIVLVRFAKTSEAAGKQLLAYANRSDELYARWYTLSAKPQNSKDNTKRWFVYEVTPQEGENSTVPQELWEFCNALCLSIMASIILPSMAQIYKQAEEAMAPAAADEAPAASGSSSLGQWGGEENV